LDGLLQEADESNYGSNCSAMTAAFVGEEIDKLHQETGELMAIFITMVSKLRKAGN